ncbi:MAG TPA: adenosine deaminase [Candidatus Dormibacteraeota bacterium]|nr:adenosine deaminase [Candidatus Dormibacteraeota bacterium]
MLVPRMGDAVPLDRLIASMPKAELHLHLDGSVRVKTALELARTREVDAPTTREGMRSVLVAPPRTASQAELLRAFDLPIELLQDAEALERVAGELVESKVADGVRYLEIRWAPLLHTRRGLDVSDGIAAVVRGATDAARQADEPHAPVVVRLICTALRTHDPGANRALARTAARWRDDGLTGWDLAGPEALAPDPLVHREAFEEARAGGLRITLHAGEWGGAPQVRRALEPEPERIAHGAVAADDPALVAELVARGITLDLCPTSNVQAGLFPDVAAHPLARLHRAGVSVTLSTDDTTVSDLTLGEEYRRAVEEIGLSPAELWVIDRRALDVAFADESTLIRQRAAFDAWAPSAGLV